MTITKQETANYLDNSSQTSGNYSYFPCLRLFQCEVTHEDRLIPDRLQAILDSRNYDLGQGRGSAAPIKVLHDLEAQAGMIPAINLQRSINQREANSSGVDLTLNHEQIMIASNSVIVRAFQFISHLKAIHNRLVRIAPVLTFWWVRTAKEALEQSGNPHGISIKDLQVLAASECSEAMGGAEEELDGILKGTAQLVSNLKAARKQAGANFKFGCDQVNFSLRDNRILSTGVSGVVPENLKPASVPLCANHTHAKVVKPAVVTDDEFLVGPELLTQEGVTECRAGLLQEIRQVKGKGDKKVKPKAVHPPGRKQGDPLPVTFNISLLAPGITKKHEGVILRKGNSKLELMAQTDSSENGIYRFMGADQPLVQMEETGKTGGKALQDPTEPPPSDPEERPLTKEPDALIGGLADAESQVVAPPTLDPGQEVPETTSAPIPSPADAGGLSSGGESEKTV